MKISKRKLEKRKASIEAEKSKRSFSYFLRAIWPLVEPNELRWNWHLDCISEMLHAVQLGQVQHALINLPPGTTKSLSVSTAFPAWVWTTEPQRKFLAATYSQSLSNKNARLHRDLVNTPWYRTRFPAAALDKKNATSVQLFVNASKGWRFSTSTEGQATGEHADYLIFDDLNKSQESYNLAALKKATDFWFQTIQTRRSDPRHTRQIGIMQRLSHADVSAKCEELGWHVLRLPMEFNPALKCQVYVNETLVTEDPRTEKGELLDPVRFPREVVDEYKESLGPIGSAAQLDQSPTPTEGAIFKSDWFGKRYKKRPDFERVIITVDAAFKDTKRSDFVAMQVWGVKSDCFYLVDCIHGRMDINKTISRLLDLHVLFPRAVIHVEDKANGPAIVQLLSSKIPQIKEWSPGRDSKESRAHATVPLFAAGKVLFPSEDETTWLPGYMREMCEFPLGTHDDQVDATTMALNILYKPPQKSWLDAMRKVMGR